MLLGVRPGHRDCVGKSLNIVVLSKKQHGVSSVVGNMAK
jgi:hypothetical protein